MRILYVTTVGVTMIFFQNFIKVLEKEGHEVSLACNNSDGDLPEFYHKNGNRLFHLSGSRNPLNFGNIVAIKQIKKLVETEKFDIVHCHSPIAAACCRIACRKARKNGTKVIYTAHGFHFYKGAPLKNWLIFYPIERLCARFTDVLITINKEDYELAKNKFKAKRVEYVPGVGIDVEKFAECQISKFEKREELGIPQDARVLLSVGELSNRKNHAVVINAIKDLDVHYVIAGEGPLHEYLQKMADDLGISGKIKLLGRRNDIAELCKAADAFVFPSFQEGLPVALMEAMATGLPIACSNIRGNTDLVDEQTGVLFDPHNVEDCTNAINSLLRKDLLQMVEHNVQKIKDYSVDKINEEMMSIYFGQEENK